MVKHLSLQSLTQKGNYSYLNIFRTETFRWLLISIGLPEKGTDSKQYSACFPLWCYHQSQHIKKYIPYPVDEWEKECILCTYNEFIKKGRRFILSN